MKTFLLLTALLNVGLGMSFTSTMLYVISGLEVASSITLLVVLVFRITSCLISNPAGNHLHHLMLFRFQQIAGFWRFVAVLALGLVASLPNGSWGIAAVLPLVAVCGISSGIMGVTGPVAVSMMVSPQRQPMSYLLFIAVTNGGAGVGAWLASLAAPNLGFPALLTLSALMFGIVLLMWHKL
jgi:predicted MFS family arabinose efflux permease